MQLAFGPHVRRVQLEDLVPIAGAESTPPTKTQHNKEVPPVIRAVRRALTAKSGFRPCLLRRPFKEFLPSQLLFLRAFTHSKPPTFSRSFLFPAFIDSSPFLSRHNGRRGGFPNPWRAREQRGLGARVFFAVRGRFHTLGQVRRVPAPEPVLEFAGLRVRGG